MPVLENPGYDAFAQARAEGAPLIDASELAHHQAFELGQINNIFNNLAPREKAMERPAPPPKAPAAAPSAPRQRPSIAPWAARGLPASAPISPLTLPGQAQRIYGR